MHATATLKYVLPVVDANRTQTFNFMHAIIILVVHYCTLVYSLLLFLIIIFIINIQYRYCTYFISQSYNSLIVLIVIISINYHSNVAICV